MALTIANLPYNLTDYLCVTEEVLWLVQLESCGRD